MRRPSTWRCWVAILAVTLTGGASAQTVMQPSSEQRLVDRISSDPSFIPAYLDLARLYYDQLRLSEAEAVLKRATTELARLRVSAVPPVRINSTNPPRKLRHVDPVIPEVAKAANIGAVFIIDLTIARDGTVKAVKILRAQSSANPAALDAMRQAALDAVSQWQFETTIVGGEPVEAIMAVSITFAP